MPGTLADFKLYDSFYQSGQYDQLARNLAGFNDASLGCLRLSTRNIVGQFEKTAFFKRVSGGLISRRDPTVTTAVTPKKFEQNENVGVKVNRRSGPVSQTLDSWKKIDADPETFSFLLGQMVAEEKTQEMIDTAIMTLAAIIKANSGVTVTAGATLKHLHLAQALQKFGDAQARIKLWVMHSSSNSHLLAEQIGDKVYGSYNLAIYQGSVATLNRPVLIMDSPSLFTADPDGAGAAVDTYTVLGLTDGAIDVVESETESAQFLPVLGNENMEQIFQAEHAYNISVKGHAYKVASGANPTNAALATAANWTKTTADDKNTAGVGIIHNAA